MSVVDFKIVTQTSFKVLRGTEVATFQKAAGQNAKPQLNLLLKSNQVNQFAFCRAITFNVLLGNLEAFMPSQFLYISKAPLDF